MLPTPLLEKRKQPRGAVPAASKGQRWVLNPCLSRACISLTPLAPSAWAQGQAKSDAQKACEGTC